MNQIESARLSRHNSPVGNDMRTDSARNMVSNSLASTAMHNHAAANSSLNHSVPTNLSEAELLYRQRMNAVPHIAVANSTSSPAVQFSANNSSLQLPPGVVLSRVQAMPQQLTVYGPNGQPGIQANLPPVMSTSAGVAHIPTTYRQILPRAPISTPTAQSNSARHNLPPQVHPNLQHIDKSCQGLQFRLQLLNRILQDITCHHKCILIYNISTNLAKGSNFDSNCSIEFC